MLPFLSKRPFHLGGVSSCLLQWECPDVSIQVNQWYVNSYFLQSYPFKYPFFIPKIFIDLLNLGVLFFIQDFFCRDVFYLLIISNLPIFLLLSLFLSRSWWPGSSFGHRSRVQSHSSSMSGQPAHSFLRACQFLSLFCQG